MGYALAEIAFLHGAEVILVSGPVTIKCSEGIKKIDLESAEEMFEVATSYFGYCDIAILSAAVADYTPAKKIKGKLKKEQIGDNSTLELSKTKDILKELGSLRNDSQILVGFALESNNLIEYAKEKLKKKNCDIIVANYANKENSGFGGDYNTISIIDKHDKFTDYLPMTKIDCAEAIIKYIVEYSTNARVRKSISETC